MFFVCTKVALLCYRTVSGGLLFHESDVFSFLKADEIFFGPAAGPYSPAARLYGLRMQTIQSGRQTINVSAGTSALQPVQYLAVCLVDQRIV